MRGGAAFPDALARWLAAVVRHDNLTILAYFRTRPPQLLLARAGREAVHANFDRVYMAGAYLLDPFHDLHVNEAPRGVYRLNEIAPDQFHRNPYFLDYYAGTSLLDELVFITYPAPGVSVHVCLGRDTLSNCRFSPRDVAGAHRFAPVVAALCEGHWASLDARSTPESGGFSEADLTTRLIARLRRERGISLSPRQAETALLILRGHSSMSIGLRLGISPQTVKVFRKQLYRKCAISSQAELFTMLLPLLGD